MSIAHDPKDGAKAVINRNKFQAQLKAIEAIRRVLEPGADLQDGMLAYYIAQAPLSDANIEDRVHNREPFDFRDFLTPPGIEKN